MPFQTIECLVVAASGVANLYGCYSRGFGHRGSMVLANAGAPWQTGSSHQVTSRGLSAL